MSHVHAHDSGDPAGEGVAPVELLFDLVFVFAMSEISRHLLADLSGHGMVESIVLLLGVFSAWLYTSWIGTMLAADQPGPRRMILGSMLMGLFMNASIRSAFGVGAWMFVLPLLMGQIGRSIWAIANSGDEVFRDHYRRTLAWQGATAPLWILGAASLPSARLYLWGAAATIDLVGTWLAHPVPGRRLRSQHVVFDANHMLERSRLLLIVAFGETVVAMGSAIVVAGFSVVTVMTSALAFIAMVALWAVYFGTGVRATLDHVANTCDPVHAARLAGNALVIMVAGLIGMAVANEMVILRPLDASRSWAVSTLLFGGAAIGLVAHAWYLRAVPRLSARWVLMGAGGLGLLAVVTSSLAHIAQMSLAAATLVVMAVADSRIAESSSSHSSRVTSLETCE